MLKNKVAVIYGSGGAVGSAIAGAFAREGARVFLTGRNLWKVDAVAKGIVDAGGMGEAAQVDALDERAVDSHLQSVIDKVGRVDVSFNAVGIPNTMLQGVPLVDLDVDQFLLPIATYARSYFLTARLAARRMVANGSGVIMTITAVRVHAHHLRVTLPALEVFELFVDRRHALTDEIREYRVSADPVRAVAVVAGRREFAAANGVALRELQSRRDRPRNVRSGLPCHGHGSSRPAIRQTDCTAKCSPEIRCARTFLKRRQPDEADDDCDEKKDDRGADPDCEPGIRRTLSIIIGHGA